VIKRAINRCWSKCFDFPLGALAVGLGTWVDSSRRNPHADTPHARYYISVWLRHLKFSANAGLEKIPARVLELGPGSRLGIGLCALLFGAKKYIALDAVRQSADAENLQLLDTIIDEFRKLKEIPNDPQFSKIKPVLEDLSLPKLYCQLDLSEKHLSEVRRELQTFVQSGRSPLIEYHAPWTDVNTIAPGTADWIISQAVLEHVDDLNHLYPCMRRWVSEEGQISHQVDFEAHGTFFKWNGHWTAGRRLWKTLRGKRHYLINRMPWSEHRRLLVKNEFAVSEFQLQRSPSDLDFSDVSDDLRPKFEPEDLDISGAFYIARRKPSSIPSREGSMEAPRMLESLPAK
jgi:hypothetical protein